MSISITADHKLSAGAKTKCINFPDVRPLFRGIIFHFPDVGPVFRDIIFHFPDVGPVFRDIIFHVNVNNYTLLEIFPCLLVPYKTFCSCLLIFPL